VKRSLGLAALVLAPLALVACDKFVRHAPKGPPPDARVVARLCASELAGPGASLRTWRDEQGQLVLLELLPGQDGRSHASTAYYDTRGRETLRVAPFDDPGSPQALDAEQRREEVTAGLRPGETVPCGADAGR
jgi:hypothetical protein